MTTKLAALLFKAMIALVPLQTHNYIEPESTTKARYTAISEDIAEVVENTNSPFQDDDKKVKIGLLLVIISSTESRWEGDVDRCLRGGDHNTSWSIFQLSNGWVSKSTVCSSRKRAVEYAIKAIQGSFNACHNLPMHSRLSGYDSGSCHYGETISVRRMTLLNKLLKDYDTDIQAL